ncbi:MAG TPA: hypothetical protein VGC06_30840 [Actinomycetes bacterium]
MTWAPVECTLSLEERPERVAAFDELFASALRGLARPAPALLRLTLDGTDRVEGVVRELVTKEQGCCPLFDFAIGRAEDGALLLEVRVADRHIGTLEALASHAAMVMADSSA